MASISATLGLPAGLAAVVVVLDLAGEVVTSVELATVGDFECVDASPAGLGSADSAVLSGFAFRAAARISATDGRFFSSGIPSDP
jgi:hypothetical protein